MTIFGIDPGTGRVGWGVIKTTNSKVAALAFGCITTEAYEKQEKRLRQMYGAVVALLNKYRPDCVCLEELFFATNAKTVISVGQALGVAMLAAAQKEIPVVSYTPLTIKQTICGTGSADKAQVQKMVTRLLKLPSVPKPDDVTDALAIALTHAYSYKLKEKIA